MMTETNTFFCAILFLFLVTPLLVSSGPAEPLPSPDEATETGDSMEEDPYVFHRELFDEWAPKYDRSPLQWGIFRPAHNLIIERLGEIPSGSSILDIACGTGILTFRLAGLVPEGKVVGVDFSPEMIKQAQAKLPEEESNVTFVEGNAEDLPFPDNSFDYVTCSFAFHHFPNPEKAVREMHRVLKNGGQAYLIDPYKSIPGGYIIDWSYRTFKNEKLYYSVKELQALFQECGFKEIDQKRLFRRLNFIHPSLLTIGIADKNRRSETEQRKFSLRIQ